MLKLKVPGPNQTVLLSDRVAIFFSYETPVAYQRLDSGEIFTTDKTFSRTTTRHINTWLAERPATVVSQAEIENLLKYVQIDPAPQSAEPDGNASPDAAPDGTDPSQTDPSQMDGQAPVAALRTARKRFTAQWNDDDSIGGPDENTSECPMCGYENVPMGNLGPRTHYRCRMCGMDYSHEGPGREPHDASPGPSNRGNKFDWEM